jgi:DNA-binding winged helix-turn-helix (wHTH) protein
MQTAERVDVFSAEESLHMDRFNAAVQIDLGPFTVHPASRSLSRDGTPVELGSRAFDVLITLLSARGQIVSKDTLLQRVWPNINVEETNLRVQLSHVRQALGEERWRIKTVPSRGYLLVADPAEAQAPEAPPRAGASNLAIVFIDANFENREYLRRMLVSAGVRVETLGSLAGLFQRSDEPDLIDAEPIEPTAYRGYGAQLGR